MDRDRLMVVEKDSKNLSDKAIWIYVDTILKSEPERIKGNNRTIITTVDGKEYALTSMNDHFVELMSNSDGFIITDRGRLANLNHEAIIDYEQRKILFTSDKVKNVFVTIAASKIENIKKYFATF